MGTLFRKDLNKHVPLRAHTLLGRRNRCDIRVDTAMVSSEHARLKWIRDSWELRDLGSRNGTFVDGQRLASGESIQLEAGSTFSLSHQGAEFELVDASAPEIVATALTTGVHYFGESGLLALPDDRSPLVTLFMNGNDEWMVESSNGQRAVVDREVLDIGGNKYGIELPLAEEETQQVSLVSLMLETIGLRLAVSPDEEQVEVTVLLGAHAKRLPPRRYHYLLVTLARAWLADENAAPSTRGWVDRDDLCRGLGMDATRLGVEIHRARKQFAALGIQNAAELIQRRSGTYEIRIGVSNVEVTAL